MAEKKAFGADDDNIEDGEDVCEEDEDDSDLDESAIFAATTPLKGGSTVGSGTPKRALFSLNISDLYQPGKGLMPAFPAGRMPFIVASAIACASLMAVILVAVWSAQVRSPPPPALSQCLSHRLITYVP